MVKKILLIAMIITMSLVSFLGITYSYEYNDDSFYEFELIGDSVMYINVFDEYIEKGINVYKNGNRVLDEVKISSLVDTSVIGEYKVKYEIDNEGISEYIYRKVYVVDNVKPIINLNGSKILFVKIFDEYVDPGYDVFDNYDKDVLVNINSNVDTSVIGEYKVEYIAIDDSGNKNNVVRTVMVVN